MKETVIRPFETGDTTPPRREISPKLKTSPIRVLIGASNGQTRSIQVSHSYSASYYRDKTTTEQDKPTSGDGGGGGGDGGGGDGGGGDGGG
jgi:hypothetical protein